MRSDNTSYSMQRNTVDYTLNHGINYEYHRLPWDTHTYYFQPTCYTAFSPFASLFLFFHASLSLSLFITFSSSLSPCTTKKMITSTKALGIKAARDGAQKAKKKRSRSERTACLLPTKTAKQYIKSSQAFSTLVGREGGWTVVTGADLCECGEMWTAHGRVQERRGIKVPVRRCWVEPCLSHACTHSEDTHIPVHIFYIGADD